MGTRTKIEIGFNQINRINGLDEFAKLLFPNNKNHQKIFLAIFIELKYAENNFLSNFSFICSKYEVSYRLLEIVRAKCRKMGLMDHVSKFNPKYGYKEGWVFSRKFSNSLQKLGNVFNFNIENKSDNQEQKDRDCFYYI